MSGAESVLVGEILRNASSRKEYDVSLADAKKRASVGPMGGNDHREIATAIATGTGIDLGSEYQNDLRRLNPTQLYAKYGSRVARDIQDINEQGNAREADLNTTRTFTETADDTITGVVNGGVSAFTSLGALGAGLINDRAGVAASRISKDISEYFQGQQSNTLNRQRAAVQEEQALRYSDNALQAIEDEKTYGAFEAGVRRFGRDFGDGASTILSNGAVAGDVIAQGLGSLLAAGPTAKLLGLAGKAATGLTGIGAAGSRAAAIGARVQMPLAVGLQEGAGAYTGAVNDSIDFFEKNEFAADAPSQDEAIRRAGSAGRTAALVQGILATSIAAIPGMSALEKAPFKGAKSVKQALGNIGAETLEESVQGATGKMAQNYAYREYVDGDRTLLEGVGGDAAAGAIGGLGSAGVVQGPSLTKAAVTVPIKALAARGERLDNATSAEKEAAFQAKVDAARAKRDAAQAQQAEATVQSATTSDLPGVPLNTLDEAINNSSAPQEVKDTARVEIDNLRKIATFTPEDTAGYSPEIQDTLSGSSDAFEALSRAIDIAKDKAQPMSRRVEAGAFINRMSLRSDQAISTNLNEAIGKIDDNDPELAMLRSYEDLFVDGIAGNPEVVKAIKLANQQTQAVKPADISSDAVKTDEGKQTLRNVANMASSDPTSINPDVINIALEHAEDVDVGLTPEQVRGLKAAKVYQDARTKAEEASKDNADRNVLRVADEVLTRMPGETEATGVGTEINRMSLKEHIRAVMRKATAGNMPGAEESLKNLAFFAAHMQNKLAAVNGAVEGNHWNDKNVYGYRAVTPAERPQDRVMFPQFGVWINPRSVNSVRLARRIAYESRVVTEAYNDMVRLFPDMGLHEIAVGEIHADLKGTVADALQRAQDKKNGVKREEAKPKNTRPATKAETTTDIIKPTAEAKPTVEAATEPASAPAAQTEAATEQSQPVIEAEERKALPAPAPAALPAPKAKNVKAPVETDEVIYLGDGTTDPTIDEAYPDLIGSAPDSKVKNLFKMAYRLSNKVSRLAALAHAYDAIKDALTSGAALADFSGREAGQFTRQAEAGYSKLLDYGPKIMTAMRARLDKVAEKQKSKKTDMLDVENTGGNVFLSGLVLNFAETQEDGSIQYSQAILEKAVLAGLQWIIDGDQNMRPKDADDIARNTQVTYNRINDEVIDFFSNTLDRHEAKRALARKLREYLGATVNKDAPLNHVDGTMEALAAEVLYGLEAQGLIKEITLNIPAAVKGGKPSTHIGYAFNQRSPAVLNMLREVAVYPQALDHAVLPDFVEVVSVGTPPARVAGKRKGSRGQNLTRKEARMIDVHQQTPNYLNESMLKLYRQLNLFGLVDLLGGGHYDENTTNVNDAQSKEGKNISMRSTWEAIERYVARIENAAKVAGTAARDMPVYFSYAVTSVGRLQAEGAQNPQANKGIRELLMPTRVTLDLTKESNKSLYFLALAQALGVKLNKNTPKASIAAVQEILAKEPVQAALAVMDTVNNDGDISNDALPILKTALGKDMSFVALHALMDYARYQATPDKTAYETFLYIEADGVTNGPAGTLLMYGTRKFTAQTLQMLSRIGYFVGSLARGSDGTPNYSGRQKIQDLYETSAEVFQRMLKKRIAQVGKGSPEASRQAQHTMDLLSELLDGVVASNAAGIFEIGRSVVKNPLTKFIYGAQPKGIAEGVAQDVLKTYYALQTARMNNPNDPDIKDRWDKAKSLMSALTVRTLSWNASEMRYDVIQMHHDKSGDRNLLTNTLSFSEFDALRTNIQQVFVRPMSEAISEVMADTLATVDVMIKASQVQGYVYTDMFLKAVQAKLKENAKKPDYIKNSFLSQNEMDGIRKSLAYAAPVLMTEEQILDLSKYAGKMTLETMKKGSVLKFSSDIEGAFTTEGDVKMPSELGVRAAPLMTINFGDARMMLIASTMANGPERSLFVYDGVHLSLDRAVQDGQAMNQAVTEAWDHNPMRAMVDNLTAFLGTVNVEELTNSEASIFELSNMLYGEFREDQDEQYDPKLTMKVLLRDARRIANLIDARQTALKGMARSVDQMAAVAKPHVENLDSAPETEETTVETLNAAALAEYERLQTPDPEPEALHRSLRGLGKVDPISGAYVIDAASVVEKISSLVPKRLAKVASAMLAMSDLSGWQIAVGTSEARAAYAPALSNLSRAGTKGISSPEQKLILLNTATAETLVHELIHAATFSAVYATLTGLDTGTYRAARKAAVENIQRLMDQFMSMTLDTKSMTAEAAKAIRGVRAAIEKAALHPDEAMGQASAINEFMAWTLTNRELSFIAGRTPVSQKLTSLVQKMFAAIRQLFSKIGFVDPQGDMLSQLQFNTQILGTLEDAPDMNDLMATTLSDTGTSDTGLEHYQDPTEQDRATDIMRRMVDAYTHVQDNLAYDEEVDPELTVEEVVVSTGIQRAFNMSANAAIAVSTLANAFAANLGLDGLKLASLSSLYEKVAANLTPEHFLKDNPDATAAEKYIANAKVYAVLGQEFGSKLTGKDYSLALPTFLALSVMSTEVRDVLAGMELTKAEGVKWGSLDGAIEALGQTAMDGLTNLQINKASTSPNVGAATDKLVNALVNGAVKHAYAAPHKSSITNRLNDYVVEKIGVLSDAAATRLDKKADAAQGKWTKRLYTITALLSRVVTKQGSAIAAEGLTSALNNMNVTPALRSLASDFVGRTDSNMGVYDLIKLAKSVVSKGREKFRDTLPSEIRDKFSRKLTEAESTAVFNVVGRSDLAALRARYTNKELFEILGSDARIDEILQEHVATIEKTGGKVGKTIKEKADQLAHWMVTREAGHFLLTNAEAVSNLAGMEEGAGFVSSPALTSAVEQYASLLAFKNSKKSDKALVRELLTSEEAGMDFTLSLLQGQRIDEQAKANGGFGKYGGFKGYMPSEGKAGMDVQVRVDNNADDLIKRGYVRVGDYFGSSADTVRQKRGYYFSPVGGRGTFTQGVMQTVKDTHNGVDAHTGFSFGMRTAGTIQGTKVVESVTRRLQAMKGGETGSETLRPVINDAGVIVAYERMISPEQAATLQHNTDFAAMIGAWRGRQFEEIQAKIYNEELMGKTADMWKAHRAKGGSAKEYINVLDPKEQAKDPVLAHTMSLMPKVMRDMAEEAFGEPGFFPVRKDMLDDTLGYPAASIGDYWSGVSRVNPETQTAVRHLTMGVFGNDAYKNMVRLERITEGFFSDARRTIVVRSVIVPIGNFVSNIAQLLGRGISIKDIVVGMPKKVVELRTYNNNLREHIRLEAELMAARSDEDIDKAERLKIRMRILEEANARLSIAPLINAGEFSTISEGLDDTEGLLDSGKFMSWMESKIPTGVGPVRQLIRYGYLTQDTPLYKALQDAVSYGDFIAKAVMYDHLTQKRGKTSAEALGQLTDEFINYDKLRGRDRQKLESLGLLWFYNFKLRAVKVGLSMVRDNPVQALLFALAPTGPLDSPMTDNFLSKLVDGSLAGSITPMMGLESATLNPWTNLAT